MTDWLLLAATLPTRPSGLRVRVWRALKAAAAAPLRDGVYLLPAAAPSAQALRDIEAVIREGGAPAYLLELRARDERQEQQLRALFDRSPAYAELLQSAQHARARLKAAGEAEQRRALRGFEQQLAAIRSGDFFPDGSDGKAAAALAALRREIEARLSPGEPAARAAAIARLSIADYRGRIWATRKRPWVDRLACAWLVRRFIDPQAQFRWIAGARQCPKGALGFDFDGAAFTHVGDKVSFEVMLASFGLEADAALRRIGELVHCIDVGGDAVDAAAGVEAIVRGLRSQHADDDRLLEAALPLFDALHAASRVER